MPSPFPPLVFDNVGPFAIMFGNNKTSLDLKRIMGTPHALMSTLFGKRWKGRRGTIIEHRVTLENNSDRWKHPGQQ